MSENSDDGLRRLGISEEDIREIKRREADQSILISEDELWRRVDAVREQWLKERQ